MYHSRFVIGKLLHRSVFSFEVFTIRKAQLSILYKNKIRPESQQVWDQAEGSPWQISTNLKVRYPTALEMDRRENLHYEKLSISFTQKNNPS